MHALVNGSAVIETRKHVVIVKVALLETGLDQLEAVSVVCGMRDRDHGRATD